MTTCGPSDDRLGNPGLTDTIKKSQYDSWFVKHTWMTVLYNVGHEKPARVTFSGDMRRADFVWLSPIHFFVIHFLIIYWFVPFLGCVQLRQGGVQVSRCVWILRAEDLLATTALLSRGRRSSQRPLRRSYRNQIQSRRHQTGQEEQTLQQTIEGRLNLHGGVSELLCR